MKPSLNYMGIWELCYKITGTQNEKRISNQKYFRNIFGRKDL